MKTCKTCKHKKQDDYIDGLVCQKINLNSHHEGVHIHEAYPNEVAFVVTDDFGCVLHEEKK